MSKNGRRGDGHAARLQEFSPRFRDFLSSRDSYRLMCGHLGCNGVLFGFFRMSATLGERIYWGARIESEALCSWMRCPECSRRNILARPGWLGPFAILRVENHATSATAGQLASRGRQRKQSRPSKSGTQENK